MAKLKLLKMPKAPKLPKKPALSASLSTKQSWIRRVNDMKAKYHAKCNAVKKENTARVSINKKSEQASKIIAGIGSITVRPSSFKSVSVRKKRSSKIGSVKRKTAKRKAAPKKRTAKRRR
jgi:hypothetical protein